MENNKWYSFRKRKLPVVNPVVFYYALYNKKTIGTDYLFYHVLENGWEHDIISMKSFKNAETFLFRKVLKDKQFITKRIKQSRKLGKSFLEFCRKKLSQENLDKKDKNGLLKLLYKFQDFYARFSVVNIAPWIFLPDGVSAQIEKALSNNREAINLLLTPNLLSYTKAEELAVLSLAIKIKEKNTSQFEKTKEFEALVKKYFWIPFDYLGPQIWDEKHYSEKIKGLLMLDIVLLKKKKKEILEYQKGLLKNQKGKIKELKIAKKLVYLCEVMKGLAVLQDEKKAITTEAHYYLQNLYKEMAKRVKVPYGDFYYLLNDEIEDVLFRNKKPDNLAEERDIFSVARVANGKMKAWRGKEAREIARKEGFLLPSDGVTENTSFLEGVSASMGKVTGLAKILLSASEIGKMKQGEILIAAMTTPDYVPAMKKAAAVVTDEGGITCHAAIVSRELGIPCVIGTKHATKFFKDGDIVEVNADKGVVKIIRN